MICNKWRDTEIEKEREYGWFFNPLYKMVLVWYSHTKLYQYDLLVLRLKLTLFIPYWRCQLKVFVYCFNLLSHCESPMRQFSATSFPVSGYTSHAFFYHQKMLVKTYTCNVSNKNVSASMIGSEFQCVKAAALALSMQCKGKLYPAVCLWILFLLQNIIN